MLNNVKHPSDRIRNLVYNYKKKRDLVQITKPSSWFLPFLSDLISEPKLLLSKFTKLAHQSQQFLKIEANRVIFEKQTSTQQVINILSKRIRHIAWLSITVSETWLIVCRTSNPFVFGIFLLFWFRLANIIFYFYDRKKDPVHVKLV